MTTLEPREISAPTVYNPIDVLPQQIALLRDDGVILAVNRAWREFALMNGGLPDQLSEGANYLQVCSKAAADGDEVAQRVLDGVRSVFAGEKTHASFEYPCLTCEGMKWFLAHVAPAVGGSGFVVSHTQISAPREHGRSSSMKKAEGPAVTHELPAKLAGLPVSIFEQDRDLRYVWIQNPALGYQSHEVIGKTDHQLMERAEEADRIVALKRRVLETGVSAQQEVRISDSAYLISFEWDIERDEIRRFVSGDPVLPATSDNPGQFNDVYRAVHPEDRERFLADLHEAMKRADGRYRSEFRIMRPDGGTAWLSEAGRVEFELGRPVRLIGLSQDITGRKRIENELRESEALSRTVFESSPDCVKVIDADERVMMISPSGLDLLELCDASPILGQNFVSLWAEDSREMVAAAIKEARAGRMAQFVGFRPTATGKPKWWDCLVAPMRGEARVGQLLIVSRDITERKRIDEALRESEATLLRAERSARAGAWDVDFVQNRVTWSEPYYELFGLSRDVKPSLEAWISSIHPDDRARVEAEYEKALRSRGTQRIQFRVLCNGEERWVQSEGEAIHDRMGRPIRVTGISYDITERKLAEKALLESQQRVQLATEATGVGIWEWNVLTDEVRWDAQMFRIYGIPQTADGMIDFNVWASAVVPEQLAEQVTLLREHARTGGVNHRDFAIVRRDTNERREVHAVEIVRARTDGQTEWVVGTNLDVTERNRSQRALLQSERRFRQLVQSLPQMVWSCNSEGLCDYLSPQWGEFTGVTVEEQLGFGWLDQLHPEDRERAYALWRGVVAEGADYAAEFRIRRHDGEYRWFQTLAVPFRDEDGRVVKWFGSNTDITEIKRATEILKDADRRKDEFLAVLAHELRNPLAPLRAGLEVLQRSGNDPVVAKRVHEMMERQVSHLVRLVDDLLEVARVSSGKIELKKQRCNLIEILRHSLETSRPAIAAGNHRVFFDPPSAQVLIDADPVRLVQIFSNLLNNAAKYTQPRGTISIKVERGPYNVIVWVRDNGNGISADMLPRVFELFTQAGGRGVHDGLGVGLALVRTLVEMHGGLVTASSEGLGKGSEFVVRLPLPQTEPLPEGAGNPETNTASRRVLVIDDDKDVADSLSMLLRLLGCNVMTAYSGASGIKLLSEFAPSIVFLDIGMPDMNGYETARRIRKEPAGQHVQLIALTGWGQDADKARTREAGFDRHLVKPADIEALEEILGASRRAGSAD